MKIFTFLCLVVLCLSSSFSSEDAPHALYLSVVEVDHKQLSEQAIIKIKIFSNDMADAYRNEFGEKVSFENPSVCESKKGQIEKYFMEHFTCSIDGARIHLNLMRCELNGDAIWFRFQSPCAKQWNQLDVKATYLMELFPTQSNVISVYHGDEKRFVNLTKSNPSQQIKF